MGEDEVRTAATSQKPWFAHAFELGVRTHLAVMVERRKLLTKGSPVSVQIEILTAERAYQALSSLVSPDVEEFWALALGPKKELLNSKMLFRGTVDSCLVHPRDVFRFACTSNASSLLIAHNHPSGERLPSMEDLRITRRLITASLMMEIPIVDHVIVTSAGYTSLRQEGWCRFEGDARVMTASEKH